MKNSDLRVLLTTVRQQGASVSYTGSGHLLIVHPTTGERVISSSTNPRGRGTQNFRAQLRRAGFDLSRSTTKKKEGTMGENGEGAIAVKESAEIGTIAVFDSPSMSRRGLTAKVQEVVEYVRAHPGSLPREVASELDITRAALYQRAARAESFGLLRTVGSRKAARYYPADAEAMLFEEPEVVRRPVVASPPVGVVPRSGLGYDFVVEAAREALDSVKEDLAFYESEVTRLSDEREKLESVVAQLEESR